MLLLTPGPVQTHPSVRAAMAEDIAPWDVDFRPVYARLRTRLLRIAGGLEGEHITLPLQGAGHMILEAALRTYVPPGASVLVLINGEYGRHLARLAREAGRGVVEFLGADTRAFSPEEVRAQLALHPECGHVAMVQSETGSGIVNDPALIGSVVRAAGRRMILDAVSAFGALPLDMGAQPELDAVVFTSNKCLEGLPGFSFAIARIDRTEASAGHAGSWSLDLADVLLNTRENGPGSMRFTGPVQTLRALERALDLFDAEGGREKRLERYAANASALYQGLRALGLKPYVEQTEQGPIVVTFHQPPGLILGEFLATLKRHGVTISSYFTTQEPTFRVGAIGDLGLSEMTLVVEAVAHSLRELGLERAA